MHPRANRELNDEGKLVLMSTWSGDKSLPQPLPKGFANIFPIQLL